MTSTAAITESIDPNTEDVKSAWAVSLCFWFALLTAASVYGSVVIAPKLAVWSEVRAEYDSNVTQLVGLEDDIEYLERVEQALTTDPEFVQRLVGISNQKPSLGEELIPVSGNLLFGQSDKALTSVAQPTESMFNNAVLLIASNTRLRTGMLCFAACLTIFAFTFLNDAGANFVLATGAAVKSAALVPVARYRKTDLDAETVVAGSPPKTPSAIQEDSEITEGKTFSNDGKS